MIVMPYYSKPSQDGLREHTLAVAGAVPAPIVLYNIPGRTVVDLSRRDDRAHLRRRAERRRHQDASGSVFLCRSSCGASATNHDPSGDDTLTLAMMARSARRASSASRRTCCRARPAR